MAGWDAEIIAKSKLKTFCKFAVSNHLNNGWVMVINELAGKSPIAVFIVVMLRESECWKINGATSCREY